METEWAINSRCGKETAMPIKRELSAQTKTGDIGRPLTEERRRHAQRKSSPSQVDLKRTGGCG